MIVNITVIKNKAFIRDIGRYHSILSAINYLMLNTDISQFFKITNISEADINSDIIDDFIVHIGSEVNFNLKGKVFHFHLNLTDEQIDNLTDAFMSSVYIDLETGKFNPPDETINVISVNQAKDIVNGKIKGFVIKIDNTDITVQRNEIQYLLEVKDLITHFGYKIEKIILDREAANA